MTDIVEQLLKLSPPFECLHGVPYALAVEAADEIKRLRSENGRLQAQLIDILQATNDLRNEIRNLGVVC